MYNTRSSFKADLLASYPRPLRSPQLFFTAGPPSRGGDVAVYVFDINHPSLPTPFYFVLVSIFIFMALSTVFHSLNSPHNSPLSHSVLPVLFRFRALFFRSYFCLTGPFNYNISLYESLLQP